MKARITLLLAGTSAALPFAPAVAQVAPASDAKSSQTPGTAETPTAVGSSAAQGATPFPAGAADPGDVVVTGSRVITNGNNSPTPVTVVDVGRILTTTPSNVPDALNKLPVFAGSRGATTLGNSGSNNVGNFLNLRGFGIIRTLILFNGHRVAATNADGTVDTNTLPQLLLQRVDVVTGGASAVYGSDAVTGVVNFIIDRKFDGVKATAQSGISDRGDAFSYRVGLAAGTDLFGGRGHLEASYERFSQDGIADKFARPNGPLLYSEEGAGTVANPFHLVANTRSSTSAFGGLILSGPLAGQQFVSNGVLGPFVHGAATGSTGIESGGDGTYAAQSSLTASLQTDQVFGRFDYDVTNTTNAYVQVSAARTRNANAFTSFGITAATFSSSNAFLPTAAQARLAAAGVQTFTFSRAIVDQDPYRTTSDAKDYMVTAGINGKIGGKFSWELFYTHGNSDQTVSSVGNRNNGRLAAALDAVVSNGQIVCRVNVTNPGVYPGCIPLNPFGPSAESSAAVAYVRGTTQFDLTNTLDDVGGSISGAPFDTWAGPVKVAVSGEYRRVGLTSVSNAQPTDKADCTGLRYNCTATTAAWFLNTVANTHASEGIAEGALEVDVPLLRDSVVARSLDFNGAVRYAHYSVSGNATTWKLGLDWHVTNDLSFRGTRSRDIRAPTLSDLFAPVSTSITGFTDTHTSTSGFTTLQTSGNPNLKPEVAQTYTVGAVYKPHWIPRLSVSVDYYDISIANAITSVGGNSAATLAQCEISGGSSPLCALYVRPLPFADRSAANYPTTILTEGLNVASTKTSGVDAEVNYAVPVSGPQGLAGQLSLRGLLSYQPVLSTLQFVGTPVIEAAGAAGQQNVIGQAKWRATFFASYEADAFAIDVQERWRASLKQSGNPQLVYSDPRVPAAAYTDLTLTLKPGDQRMRLFLSVQNLLDKQPPVFISTSFSSNPGFFYPAVAGDDVIGRYFTAGVRLKF